MDYEDEIKQLEKEIENLKKNNKSGVEYAKYFSCPISELEDQINRFKIPLNILETILFERRKEMKPGCTCTKTSICSSCGQGYE
jgi:hypothetical protein